MGHHIEAFISVFLFFSSNFFRGLLGKETFFGFAVFSKIIAFVLLEINENNQ